jgi:hypothetical protein
MYSRATFEAIWEGYSHLCPYYDIYDAFYFDVDVVGRHDENSCLQCKELAETDKKELESQKIRAIDHALLVAFSYWTGKIGPKEEENAKDEVDYIELEYMNHPEYKDWKLLHGAEARVFRGEVFARVFPLDDRTRPETGEPGRDQRQGFQGGVDDGDGVWYSVVYMEKELRISPELGYPVPVS